MGRGSGACGATRKHRSGACGATRTYRAVAVLASAVLLLGACTADPPPAIQSTDSPKPTQTEPAKKKTVVVAVDDVGIGLNPHLLSDLSPTTAAVASLVLPSPFRPVSVAPGVSDWVLDKSVMSSVEISAVEPFTITYQVRDDAQWSDGAPIAAEDFRYLWQQMISQPGTVDPAGYQLVEDVQSSGGGKTVTVKLKAQYPAWRTLFANLVPSHLIKDAPGGFARGLADEIAASGAHFSIRSMDRGRGELVLERNDRFWDTPAKPDQIQFRRAGSAAQLSDSLRSGDVQAAVVHGAAALKAQVSAIPGVRTAALWQPRELQFTLNARTAALTDGRVRAGLLALLDPGLLATVAADTGALVEPVRAQILSPSDPGYAATAPVPPARPDALGLLAQAGYQQVAEPATQPRILKDAKPFGFVIGAPDNDVTATAVANSAADQLRGVGIDATVEELPADELYGSALVERRIDAVVGWVGVGSDPATAVLSRFGCPPPEQPQPTGTARAARAPSNLGGVCDPTIQATLEAAVRGVGEVNKALADVEPKLWGLQTVLPVVQDATLGAVGGGVEGVVLGGPIQVPVFSDAAAWIRK